MILADFVCAVVLVAMGIRLEFLKVGKLPERRRFLSLRRPLSSELSKEYYAYHRRLMWLTFAFVMTIAMGALLFWIDNSIFRAAD